MTIHALNFEDEPRVEEPPKTLFQFALEHLRGWHQLHVVQHGDRYQLFEENEAGILHRYRSQFEDEEGLTREELLLAVDELDIENYCAVLCRADEEAELSASPIAIAT